MKQIRLKNTTDLYFHEMWKLYQEAFPVEEQRTLEEQSLILKKDDYHLYVFLAEEQFIGFIMWWDFTPYRYIDHFATAVKNRNKGFGKTILTQFLEQNTKPVLLEVELPTSDINQRRIQFYERLGLKLNPHFYTIPTVDADQRPWQLLVMSYPDLITEKDLKQFVEQYHPILFEQLEK